MTAADAISSSPAGASRLPAVLWMAFALFIVYGGTIPFHFTSDRAVVLDKLSRVTLNPLVSPDTGRRVSIPDVVQNILLFIPFGALGVTALRPRRSELAAIIGATALAAVLSASVETLQLFETDRTTSLSDLCANVMGAFGGAAAAATVLRVSKLALLRLRARGLVDVPAFYPLLIVAIVLCAAAWEPFDFTLDVGTLVGKLRALHADPWQFVVVSDEGVEVVRYAIFGLVASLWLRQLGVRSAATVAAVGGAAVAVGLEASQWIIGSRMPGLEDATVHAAGALAGVALSRRWPWGRSPVFWCVVLWFGTALGAAFQLLSPFEIAAVHRPFFWLPFIGYYAHTTFETVSHGFELVLLYFPLGFALSIAGGRRRSIWIAVAVTLLIAAPLEYLQGWIVGRYDDVTDVAVAVLGAAIGVWTAGAGSQEFWRSRELHGAPAHNRR
jgi:VanZ family protein